MGTRVRVLLPVVPDAPPAGTPETPPRRALESVRSLFAALERRLSRFLPDSELSRLNAAAGRREPFAASPTLGALLGDALRLAGETGGAFDPTILPALAAAGYDRSFELVAAGGAPAGDRRGGQPPPGPALGRPCSWRDVALRRAGRRAHVSLPPGCALDLGGIGKGWAADRAAALLRRAGFGHFALDAGGDVYAAGAPGDGGPWTVGVEDPADAERDVVVLGVRNGAVATSTTARRRWRRDGREMHHLIDPRTGWPAASGVAAATVVAPTVARAEALAKAAVILGPREGLQLLERAPDAEGLLVLDGGCLVMTEGLRRAAGPA